MAITISQIGDLLARFGNGIVNDQVNFACPFVGNGHIQKIKHSHEQGIVRVRTSDGLQSTGQLNDGAFLPEGQNVSFTAGSYLPKVFFTRLSIPRGAAHLADGGRDGVRLVREELEVAGRQLGKVLGQAVFAAPVATVFATGVTAPGVTPGAVGVANANTTVQAGGAAAGTQLAVDTIAGLYEGQFLSLPTAAAANGTSVQITEIVYNENEWPDGSALTFTAGAYTGFTIRVSQADAAAAATTTQGTGIAVGPPIAPVSPGGTGLLSQQTGGNNAAGTAYELIAPDPMVSLGEAAGNAAMYAMPTPPAAYTGNTQVLNGALTASAMRDMSTTIKRRAGYGWHMLVMNSNNLQRYFENTIATTAALNFLPGETTKDSDGGSAVPMFQGLPIVVDENVDDNRIYFFNKDDIKLAEFKDFGPDQDGTNSHGMVDRTKLIYDTQIWGMYNMRVQRRNSMGMISGITA
jgi:hypothetical protein